MTADTEVHFPGTIIQTLQGSVRALNCELTGLSSQAPRSFLMMSRKPVQVQDEEKEED
jgi:hypothetical protein